MRRCICDGGMREEVDNKDAPKSKKERHASVVTVTSQVTWLMKKRRKGGGSMSGNAGIGLL